MASDKQKTRRMEAYNRYIKRVRAKNDGKLPKGTMTYAQWTEYLYGRYEKKAKAKVGRVAKPKTSETVRTKAVKTQARKSLTKQEIARFQGK